ncbi:acyl carrier protein [Nonomuraea aurantiaca]|uniref:acyl carrier protein n=1 Tax=Nonomuraea aurantiaca TaxID=2878562 RepID=UPI001CDA033E|nr:acyl carrier protein [Nonomuraea aurantiaca]MCA2222059.1 acyl carrier protein [Nonomuraea aurantiaca]
MEIEGTIKKILATELFVETPAEEISDQESLRDIYGLDSLGFTELRVQCEDIFDVRVSDEDFVPENFRTIAALAALIRRLQGGGT